MEIDNGFFEVVEFARSVAVALSIGVGKGSRIKVGDSMLRVVEIVPGVAISVQLDGNKTFMITDSERTEIMPGVFVQIGLNPKNVDSGSRLAFEAPRSITINRVRHG